MTGVEVIDVTTGCKAASTVCRVNERQKEANYQLRTERERERNERREK